jgi:hypothetical protein
MDFPSTRIQNWNSTKVACSRNNIIKEPFSIEGRLCTIVQVIGLVHYDVWGSTKTTSLGRI